MATFDERSQQYAQEYIQDLLDHYQESLLSVVLYGSAATPQYTPGQSDINVLVVFDEIDLGNMKEISSEVRKYKIRGLEPLYVSRSELIAFGDLFPMEASDIKENYSVLYGEDLVRDLRVSQDGLIEQLIRELLAKTIRLRFLFDEFNADKKQLEIIIKDVVSPFRTLMRTLLKTFDRAITPPYEYLEILAQLEERHGMLLEGFREAFLVKSGKTQLSGNLAQDTMERIVRESEALYQYAMTFSVRHA